MSKKLFHSIEFRRTSYLEAIFDGFHLPDLNFHWKFVQSRSDYVQHEHHVVLERFERS
jgi:hypothetical protein